MKLNSHAKINMFLHITRRYENGYHGISSFAVFLHSLYDEILITDAEKTEIIFESCDICSDNTVSRALLLLKERGFDHCFKLEIKKRIPLASGMAGGSSNAATVLNYLSSLYKIDNKIIFEIGHEIGSDMQLCLYNKASLVFGLGEQVEAVKHLPKIFLVIVNNKKELLSSIVYQECRKNMHEFSQEVDETMLVPDLLEKIINFRNDLQPFAMNFMPEIREILWEIQNQDGCVFSRMSGSGPTCFGAFYSEKHAKIAEKNLQNSYKDYCVLFSSVF